MLHIHNTAGDLHGRRHHSPVSFCKEPLEAAKSSLAQALNLLTEGRPMRDRCSISDFHASVKSRMGKIQNPEPGKHSKSHMHFSISIFFWKAKLQGYTAHFQGRFPNLFQTPKIFFPGLIWFTQSNTFCWRVLKQAEYVKYFVPFYPLNYSSWWLNYWFPWGGQRTCQETSLSRWGPL